MREFEDKLKHQVSENRLLIVDGSNLLFQMFFGMPARIVNEHGKAIQGTLGFVGALLKMIRKTNSTHIVVVFDGEHENPRSALDTGYKANRINYSELPEKDTPFSQLPDVYEALDYLLIRHMETTTCEADDLIASYALTYGQKCEIVISSLDSDFFQLITDRISVLRYRGDNTVICTSEYIRNKFGIEPGQYADFKSLTGDSSDNIKGADKIGPKTAAYLLNEFGNLETILANAGNIKKASVRESIIQSSDKLKINYQMIKLGNKAQIPFGLDELAYEDNGVTTSEVLKGIGLK